MTDRPLTAEEAEEFTQALELVLEGNAMSLSGGWRLRADGVQRGVPAALGLTIREWCDRVGAQLEKWSVKAGRRDVVKQLAEEEEMSTRQIAAVLGVGQRTVVRDLDGESDGSLDPKNPAAEAEPEDDGESTDSPEPEDGAPPSPEGLAEPAEPTPHKTRQRKQRDQKAEAKRLDRDEREAHAADPPPPDLRVGALSEALADVTGVDLVFTDPPYPREFLPVWSDLAEWAARALKPGALLVAYSGQYHLPEVMRRLGEHLTYQWLGWIATTGPQVAVHQRPIMSGGKPLLIFSSGTLQDPYGTRRFFDSAQSGGRTRELHEWEQDEAPAAYYLDALTERGELVCDPFLGSGTFAKVARDLGRRFIGCDIDADAITATIGRLGL